jgi:hypothetical protein
MKLLTLAVEKGKAPFGRAPTLRKLIVNEVWNLTAARIITAALPYE